MPPWVATVLLQWILNRPGDKNGYMWCPHARVDTENEPPRAKPIPLEQYFQLAESSLRRATATICPVWLGWLKMPKNDQNDVKIENFIIFPNGPKWIKVASKWSKMAPKPIFGPFGHVFVPFWPVPPSF